jgi:hypothetical protein
MFRKKQGDERVTNMQNKIYKEMYLIVTSLSIVSIVIKFAIYGIDFNRVISEEAIVFIPSVYYVLRAAFLGLFSDEVEMHDRSSKYKLSTKTIIIGLALGVALSLIFATNSAVNFAEGRAEAVYFFILVFFVSFMIYVPLFAGYLGLTYLAAKRISDQVVTKQLKDREDK